MTALMHERHSDSFAGNLLILCHDTCKEPALGSLRDESALALDQNFLAVTATNLLKLVRHAILLLQEMDRRQIMLMQVLDDGYRSSVNHDLLPLRSVSSGNCSMIGSSGSRDGLPCAPTTWDR